jgi:hypothetical protein
MKKPKYPTIMEESASREPFRAKWWRTNIAQMTPQEIADLTGYSLQVIYLMERGITSEGKLVKPWAWRRYKMACAGVEYRLLNGHDFNWQRLKQETG